MKITNEQENILKTEIDTITIFLQKKMKEDADGYYWETIHYDGEAGQFSYKFNNSIWNGTPGIIIFFLSLYAYSRKTEHLDIAKKATDKALKMQNGITFGNTSLFDGVAGLIYLCVKLFEQSSDKSYLNSAEKLATLYRSQILAEREDDILGGKAGSLYALTFLYHYTQNKTLLVDIRVLIQNLIDTAKLGKQGIGWGTGILSLDKLCGFSHGASGIGHVLLQVGTYFREPELLWLAEQAFVYEKEYYDPDINNWMDLRWTSDNDDLPGLFEWKRETFMPTNFDVNAWAHGAAGIGLARLHAWQLTQKQEYETEISAVLERCIYDLKYKTKKSYLLFSGYGGLADFFILYSQLVKNQTSFQKAITIGLDAIAHGKLTGHHAWGVQGREDLGLLTGTAGIGFMLLRILDKGQFDSILHPTLPASEKVERNTLGLSEMHVIRTTIYHRYFSRTTKLLSNKATLVPDIFGADNIDEFEELLDKKVATLHSSEKDYARDVLELESLTTQLWKDNKGSRCFQTRLAILKTDLESYHDEKVFGSQKFVINPFVKVFPSEWDCSKENDGISEPGRHWNILYASDDRVHHFVIGKFPAIILFLLQNPLTIYELADRLSKEIPLDKDLLLEKLLLQVKELLERFFIRAINK